MKTEGSSDTENTQQLSEPHSLNALADYIQMVLPASCLHSFHGGSKRTDSGVHQAKTGSGFEF